MPYGSNLENALKTLHVVNNSLKEGLVDHDEAAQLIKSNKDQIIKALLHCNARPFIVAPSQLDTTQPEDLGYGTPEWKRDWLLVPKEARLRKADLGHNLSACRNLQYKVMGKNYLKPMGDSDPTKLVCEIARSGMRRCCFVKSNGMRCLKYDKAPVCKYHSNLVAAVPYMNDRFLEAIKNESLKEAYKKHLQDPNRRSIESELALQRTMLNVLVSRCEVGMALQDLPMEQIGAITAMCTRITETAQKMVDMETKMAMRMTIEQVTNLLMTVATKLIEITSPTQEQCLKIADVIENLPVRRLATETVQGNADYGMAAEHKVINSNGLTKYTEDGAVTPNAFTPEQVALEKQWVNEKFAPAQAAYRAKQENLLKRQEEIQ